MTMDICQKTRVSLGISAQCSVRFTFLLLRNWSGKFTFQGSALTSITSREAHLIGIMKITSLFVLILLTALTPVTSVTTSTYPFSFQISISGPDGVCTVSNIRAVARKLTIQVGMIINQYLSNNGMPGDVSNITITSGSNVRFLGEGNADWAVDALLDEEIDDTGVRKLLFKWNAIGAGVCRLCLPQNSVDARRTLRRLQAPPPTVLPKAKISAYLNERIEAPTRKHIVNLENATNTCRDSSPQWSSVFTWL